MSKKQTLVNKFNELRKRLVPFALVGTISLTGCATQQETKHEVKGKNVHDIIHQIDEKIIQENQLDQAQEIINDINLLMPKLKVDGLNGKEHQSLVKDQTEEVNFYDTIDISNYHGNSIEDALRTSGYGYSFAFREDLAHHFGIQDYRGTAAQNLKLLECLRKNHIQEGSLTQVTRENEANDVQLETSETVENDTLENKNGVNSDIITDQNTGGLEENKGTNLNPDGSISNENGIVGPGSQTNGGSNQENNQNPSRPGHGSTHRPGGGNGSSNGGSHEEDNGHKNPNKPGNNDQETNKPIEHKHNIQKEVSYNIKGNGIHEAVIKEYCTAGDYVNYKNQEEKCSYLVLSYDENDELIECKFCGDKVTRKHAPVAGEPLANGDIPYTCAHDGCDWTYVKSIDNECNHEYSYAYAYQWKTGDMHTKTTTITCPKCDFEEVKKEDETCQYTVLSYTAGEDSVENVKCSDCGHETTRGHAPVAGEPLANGDIPYTCAHEGCDWTFNKSSVIECNHQFAVNGYDDNLENLVCPKCGETKTRSHKKVAGIADENGNLEYFCENEGCDWTKKGHVHHKEEDEIIVGTADICTKIVTTCTVDGCTEVFEEEINSDHKFRVTSEGVQKECRVCGYDPRKAEKLDIPKEKENLEILDEDLLFEDEVILEEDVEEIASDGKKDPSESGEEYQETVESSEALEESEDETLSADGKKDPSESGEEYQETVESSEALEESEDETLSAESKKDPSESREEYQETVESSEALEESEEETLSAESKKDIPEFSEESQSTIIIEEDEEFTPFLFEADEYLEEFLLEKDQEESEEKGISRKLVLEDK